MTDRTRTTRQRGGVSPARTPGACVTHGARGADTPVGTPETPPEVTVKKVLTWLALAFVIFYIISAPESSADLVRTAGHALGDAATSLASFFQSLA